MPSILGKYYGGQWAIYSCSMLTAALYNISRIYPEEKEQNIQRIERLIDIVLSPELREYDRLNKAKTIWRHKSTGLLKSKLPTKKNTKRRTLWGSYSALNCYYLSLIDPEFAESQYYSLVKAFYSDDVEDIFWGIHEYLQKRPRFKLDVDAGPIVFGLSASGTAFAIGAATFFKWLENKIKATSYCRNCRSNSKKKTYTSLSLRRTRHSRWGNDVSNENEH